MGSINEDGTSTQNNDATNIANDIDVKTVELAAKGCRTAGSCIGPLTKLAMKRLRRLKNLGNQRSLLSLVSSAVFAERRRDLPAHRNVRESAMNMSAGVSTPDHA